MDRDGPMNNETFMELLTEATDLLAEAEFIGERDAIRHLKCAETVETLEDLIANLNEAAATANRKSSATKCRRLAAKCQKLGKKGEHHAQR